MKKLSLIALFSLLLITLSYFVWAEQITLTTYYPAPYGVYNDMVVMNSLGIGTTAPDYKLDVSSSDTSNTFAGSATIKITNTETTAFGRHQSLVFGYNNIAGAGISGIYNNWGATNRGGHILAFYTKNSATEATPQEKMRIDKNGNVGIGTTSPGAKLEVNGDIIASMTKVEAACDTARAMANSSHTTIIFEIENDDELGEYNNATGIFTATKAGTYIVSWSGLTNSVAWDSGEAFYMALSKNNASLPAGGYWRGIRFSAHVAHTGYASSVGSAIVTLAATDTLRIKGFHSQGASITLIANDGYNYFHIARIP